MPAELAVWAPAVPREVAAGDDLAEVVAAALAGRAPRPGDIVVLAQKIVSKAEGRLVSLATVRPGPAAIELAARTRKDARLVELVLRESQAVVRARPGVLIVRHRLGLVMANAGIDQSNLPGAEMALLLPEDPDGSAERLRAALADRLGVPLGVIISDSFGRAWRRGSVNVAIGAAGIASLWDRRGERDRSGRPLAVTEVAVADAVAAAAGLAMGEGREGRPLVLVRGWSPPAPASPAAALIRPVEEDLFP